MILTFDRSNEYDSSALIKRFSSSVAKTTGIRHIVFTELTIGADYVALILPHQGGLVVEATFVFFAKLN